MLEGDNCEYTISELLADEQAGEEWEMVGVGVGWDRLGQGTCQGTVGA